MAVWEKKAIAGEIVKELHTRYGCDALTASILARRSITGGQDVLFYLENDERYFHNPFLIDSMEDAVDRILDAREEGEKVLIFGDRDVDGITSTTLLYEYLCELGIDVQWRLPSGNDAYGLSMDAVNDFAKEYGTLIITVDCGISNCAEIARANELGIDVIVTDHHNPPEALPEAAVIINPKIKDSGYPFRDISGCAVVYKLVCALRFAQSSLYKQEICLLNVRPANDAYIIEGLKIINMAEKQRITETIIPGIVSITQTRLLPFLARQHIYVWDVSLQQKQLKKIFGGSAQFNLTDIRPEIAQLIPSVENCSLLKIREKSRIVRYQEKPSGELDSFFNIFITYILQQTTEKKHALRNAQDLQLVSLAALADIMPLKNENRIFIRKGLASMNAGQMRHGLLELASRLNLLGKHIGSAELSWNIIPVLNAAGRLGRPELAMQLFAEKDSAKRDQIAAQIIELNKERKKLGAEAWKYAEKEAYSSMELYGGKLIMVADEHINRGVTGIVAAKLAKYFDIPAMVIAFLPDGTAVGSMRSVRGYDITGILDSCSDLFINHGGHNFAAGFSFKQDMFPQLSARIEQLAKTIEFAEEKTDETLSIDAELPHNYITPDLLSLTDKFEPYGEGNPQLLFSAKNIRIAAADIIGKTEKPHLKLTLECGKLKWPALFWDASSKLKTTFSAGDYADIVFEISRNSFNGIESAQIILKDIRKASES
ncbi:MAG: single-stranded-DNA-specific exonuclease RecJ [Bacteroides sp.]|nr:single-stranded-DNA-specific exonuclease RecJ [Prevotella sp.]MCM1407472.1 single-stranded-DNA-specific exonuclease RecJ [Treponema brennaborense]MCM1469962.1 single-stranded-DNA-specific exonuclease RecJ [Bacteroides sp.]